MFEFFKKIWQNRVSKVILLALSSIILVIFLSTVSGLRISPLTQYIFILLWWQSLFYVKNIQIAAFDLECVWTSTVKVK
ncbi:MAG TPA: hypothetical protein DHW61_00740 [Lachnoclostridium phytofermentans]|uniref:Uncharacterized protein n=1 Tax=Lachnoclostridium phytofermentans TaxID=66219 RepID=A0A3D2X3K7_9FIRM|nr:hypothetical protein [Lachnoclostridium phytofermentans]